MNGNGELRKQKKQSVQSETIDWYVGQMDRDDLKNSMFDPKWQHMENLTPDAESMYVLTQLMGDDTEYKKQFVVDNIDFSQFVSG